MSDFSGIMFERVTRRFGPVLALNDVSVTIGPGITGLVGPNGAGKTTLLSLAVGLSRFSSGAVRLEGRDPFLVPAARARLGYCPDRERCWEQMTGREFVVTLGRWAGLSADQAASRTAALLERLELGDAADRPIAQYSKGMRQKVKVAQALLHEPGVIVLDEPLNGVDPLSRHQILRMVEERAAAGTSVLISSHVLHELDGLVDQVVLLQRGRLLAAGSVESIRSLLDEHPHSVRLTGPGCRRLASLLVTERDIVSVTVPEGSDDELLVRTREPGEFYSRLPRLVVAAKAQVTSLQATDNDLESVFNYLVKRGPG